MYLQKYRKWSLYVATLATAAFLLHGCGGGSDGSAGPAGAAGAAGATGATGATGKDATATVKVSAMTSAAWASSEFKGEITGVTVASPPVVTFKVTDANGNPVVGLGGATQTAAAGYTTYPNVAFNLSKLVPGTNGSPSKWVNMLVTSHPSVGTTKSNSLPQKPNTENYGTLVDNGDGSYKYTFWHDITKIKDDVASMAAAAKTANANNDIADLGDLTYEPSLTHRVGIAITGAFRGTGANTADGVTLVPAMSLKTPTNLFYDFVPATGAKIAEDEADGAKQRNIVNVKNCFQCHSKFTFHGGNAMTGVGGSRQDTKMCVLCHTDQRKYGTAATTMNAAGTGFTSTTTERIPNNGNFSIKTMPQWIHKIHMGEHLLLTGYATNIALEARFPQDPRNCTKCHDGSATPATATKTAQGDNWKNVPNRLACGACHDGINFNTGGGQSLNGGYAGHVGGAKADDKLCSTCHTPEAIILVHTPVTPPNPANALLITNTNPALGPTANANTNASYISVSRDNLPAGAKRITYDLKSVTLNSSRQPVFTFRFMDSTTSTATPIVFNTAPATADATKELMANFVGSTSVNFVASLPQDGVATPADFNLYTSAYIRNCWNKTAPAATAVSSTTGAITGTGACTMVEGAGADAGYYVLTMTGVAIPTSAVMMTGGLGYTYNVSSAMPLTQTNVPGYAYNAEGKKQGGLSVPAPNVTKVVSGALPAGFAAQTARRQAVEPARCNNCHNALGVFMDSNYHAGQRNDSNSCAFCHTPNRTNGGWYVGSSSHVHAIHAAAKRTVPFTWGASSPAAGVYDGFWNIGYPGVLRNCQQCHLPNTVNFGNTANAAAVANLLPMTAAAGIINGVAGTTVTTYSHEAASGTCKANGTWGTTTAPFPQTAAGAYVPSPYVTKDGVYNYGVVFTANLSPTLTSPGCTPDGAKYTIAPGGTREADPQTLVHTPVSAACFACHTTNMAMAHMRANGGSLYATRGSVLTGGKFVNNEQCLVCHGVGKVADVEVMHIQTVK